MTDDKARQAGRLLVLVGGDGCGKSTLISWLAARRPEWRFASSAPHALYPHPDLGHMSWTLEVEPRHYVQRLRPLARSAFFVTTLAVQFEYQIAPALAAGSTVISDSYFYRHLAKERLQNPSGARLLEPLRHALPQPQAVYWLDVPATELYRRKRGSLSSFEVESDFSMESFVRFQNAVRQEVFALATDIDLHVIDANRAIPLVGLEILEAIDHLGGESVSKVDR